MWRVGLFIFALSLCTGAEAATESFTIPLSKVTEGNISVEYVCRKDGVVGPFIKTSKVAAAAPETSALFTSMDVIRHVTFFEKEKNALTITFPQGWRYLADTTLDGFFLATTSFAMADGTPFSDQVKTLTGLSQLYFLQIAATKYVAVDLGGRKFVAEIDLSGVTNEKVVQCFEFAGYADALADLKRSADARMEPADLKYTCLALFGFYNGVEDALKAGSETSKARAQLIRFPAAERSDCFLVKQLSQADVTMVAVDAASLLGKMDYLGLAQAAQAQALPNAAYAALKQTWNAKDLPGLVTAEKEKVKSDQLSKLKYTYTLYGRILSCNEAFKEARTQPFSEQMLGAYRTRMRSLEDRYKPQIDMASLWDESMVEYPAMLSSMKYSITVNSTLAIDTCIRNAGLFDIFSAKLVGGSGAPKKDF